MDILLPLHHPPVPRTAASATGGSVRDTRQSLLVVGLAASLLAWAATTPATSPELAVAPATVGVVLAVVALGWYLTRDRRARRERLDATLRWIEGTHVALRVHGPVAPAPAAPPSEDDRALRLQLRSLEAALEESSLTAAELRRTLDCEVVEGRLRERRRSAVAVRALGHLITQRPDAVGRVEAALLRLGEQPAMVRPPLADVAATPSRPTVETTAPPSQSDPVPSDERPGGQGAVQAPSEPSPGEQAPSPASADEQGTEGAASSPEQPPRVQPVPPPEPAATPSRSRRRRKSRGNAA
jgi:hypothetical protein